jgi:transcriptional regulator with XRE-family HTH domain
MTNLGRRIRAARAHAGISRETLAESLAFTVGRLERLEAGVDEPSGREREDVIRELADATRLPTRFFTVDYDQL